MTSLPPLPLIDGCLFIDNSAWMEGMSSCYRYLEYKSLHLRIPSAEKPSLNFGSVQHLAREFRYCRYQNKPIDSNYYNDLSSIFTDFFSSHPPPDGDWRTLNWAIEIDRRYNDRYEREDFNLLEYGFPIDCPHCHAQNPESCIWCSNTGKRNVMVELPFALPLFTHKEFEPIIGLDGKQLGHEIPIIYTGRIDLPISLEGSIYVMDHKHVGQLGNMFWDEQRMTSQQRGYVWAFQELAKVPVKGYIVNAIRTKEPPLYVTDPEKQRGKKYTPETWWSESFARERFLIKPNEIQEWKNNTIDLVEEFFWHYSRGFMPQKTKWCSSYGRCPYYDVCQLISTDRGALLQSGQFMDNNWSPLNQKTQSKQ